MKRNLWQWLAWRDDYRCARPEPVTCKGCGTHYPVHKDAAVMRYLGFNLSLNAPNAKNAEERRNEENQGNASGYR